MNVLLFIDNKLLIAMLCFLLMVALWAPTTLNTLALPLDHTEWSTPVVLSTNPQAFDPHLTIDPYGTVRAVWAGASNPAARATSDTIYYSRWEDLDWSDPVDILVSPQGGQARYPVIAATTDSLHVTWAGGMGDVYFSSASICSAQQVMTWSFPRLIIGDNLTASRVDMVSDATGILHLVYAQEGENTSNIAYMRSENDGITWSSPIPVSQAEEGVYKWLPRLAVDDVGVLHVVWSEITAPEGVPPLGVAYTHSVDGGMYWSTPIKLSDLGYGRATVFAINNREVHVVWSGTVGYAGRYHQWSWDGGQTWSTTVRLPGVEQSFGNGFSEGVLDANGILHLITGVEYMSYLAWNAGEWTSAQRVWNVDYTYGDPVTEGGMPRMVLSGGNRLIALWHDNWRVFFATKLIDAEPVPFSVPLICSTPALPETEIEIVVDNELPARPYEVPDLPVQRTPSVMQPLVMGILPVIALVMIIISLRSRKLKGFGK